jgi:hypothetical protein
LYSSVHPREIAERAVRAAIGARRAEWTVCLVAPLRQPPWVIVVDGPNAFVRTWIFDEGTNGTPR